MQVTLLKMQLQAHEAHHAMQGVAPSSMVAPVAAQRPAALPLRTAQPGEQMAARSASPSRNLGASVDLYAGQMAALSSSQERYLATSPGKVRR